MSRFTRRQASHPPWLFLALAIALMAAGLGYAGAQTPTAQPKYSDQAGSFDYFATDPKETSFDFRGQLALPNGFFDKGSARYAGPIRFKGVPVRTFQDRKTGNADTVVARTNMPRLGSQYPSRGTAEIQLAALSLESVRPIKVNVGKRTQLWDVKLGLSSKRPSRGKMNIVQENERGGVFDSEFTVYPSLTFVRQSDRAERVLDIGSMKLGGQATKSLTLRASSVPWSTQAPREAAVREGNFFAGVRGTVLVPIRHQIPPHSHLVILARELDIPNVP